MPRGAPVDKAGRYPFPNRFMILPDINLSFGPLEGDIYPHGVRARFTYRDMAEVMLTWIGGYAFKFLDGGPLQSFDKLDWRASGAVPEEVRKSEIALVDLQTRRLNFSNFVISACVGFMAPRRHQSMANLQHVGLHQIVEFSESPETLLVPSTRHHEEALGPRVRRAQAHGNLACTDKDLEDLCAFFADLALREDKFQSAALRDCMQMNCQAAMLHHQQQAAASVALSCAVAEALIDEIFYVYGLVGKSTRQSFATKTHNVQSISKRKFSDLRLRDKLDRLKDGGLIDEFLFQRMTAGRKLRNSIMHKAELISPSQSGDMLTVVRDLWVYLLEHPFELLMGWNYRI